MKRIKYVIILFICLIITELRSQELSDEMKNYINNLKTKYKLVNMDDGIIVYRYDYDFSGDGRIDCVLSLLGHEYKVGVFTGLVYFKGENGYYKKIDELFYETGGGEGTIESITVENIIENKLNILVTRWGKNDNNCCPSIEEKYIVTINYNKLISNKKIERRINLGGDIEQPYYAGGLKLKIDKVEFKKEINFGLGKMNADGEYLIINMTIENLNKEEQIISNKMFVVSNREGYRYETAFDLMSAYEIIEKGKTFLLKALPPKIPKKIIMPYEVPNKNDSYYLEINWGYGKNDILKIRLN